MSERCPGHCCRLFWLPFTSERLLESINARVAHGDDDRVGGWLEGVLNYDQAEQVAGMVVYRGMFTREQLVEYGGRRGLVVPLPGKLDVSPGNWYTCRLFDDLTNLCTDYENRPDMCRNFPWFGRCIYPGCGHLKPDEVFHNGKLVAVETVEIVVPTHTPVEDIRIEVSLDSFCRPAPR